VCYKNLCQHQRGIKNFNTVIHLKPDYADTYNNMGTVYLNQGNNKLGCPDAQKACVLGNCQTLDAAKGSGYCR
jgi:tetratricopeptide (TPR) repeat protein